MAIYDGDQQTGTPVIINGVKANITPAVLKAIAPLSTVYTFTSNYAMTWNGAHVVFRKGVSYQLDAAQKAALLAASAPMVAA